MPLIAFGSNLFFGDLGGKFFETPKESKI